MNATPSRYLSRLEADIAKAGDTVDGDCLRAEKAAYLARQGRGEEATSAIRDIQTRHQRRPRSDISSWVGFAEAMVMHFGEIKPTARERLLRAQAIAAAEQIAVVDALCSAWLALLDYGRNDFVSMDRFLRRALALAPTNSDLVRARATMVAALAFHFAGRPDLAEPWYVKCREHNAALGDDATWSAVLHNMAWARLGELRQCLYEGRPVGHLAKFTLMSADSVSTYDALTGASSLQALTSLLRAQILSLTDQHAEATELFDRELPSAEASGFSQWLATMGADHAVSLVALGQSSAALLAAVESEARIDTKAHPDDRGAAHTRLASAFRRLGDEQRATVHELAAAAAWVQHREKQAQILALLASAPAIGVVGGLTRSGDDLAATK